MKKGFTLIELLAVIVILAIIALIATPIILGIIKNAKNESNERSVDLYVKAAELAVARKNLTSEFKPTECTVEDGECTCDGETLNVEVENGKGINGTITFNDKGIVTDNTLVVGTANEKEPEEDETQSKCNLSDGVCANGEIVYIDITTGKGCNNYNEENSKTGYNGLNPTGNQTSCLKFYAFNDTEESDKVNLLLDHNTTGDVVWYSSYNNTLGPNKLLTQLNLDTSGWNTSTPTSYTSQSKGYTVNYTKARLITAQEIAQITGKIGWDEKASSSSWYYFDTKSTSMPTERNYGWLYDRTSSDCESYGCLHNSDSDSGAVYWTVSAVVPSSDDQAWSVTSWGALIETYVFDRFNPGVRPVIEVSKSSLN